MANAEKVLQRLRTLPENRICPNCGKKDTTFGFQAVCMAFKTFICSDCKSAHQAFSHRCKSISMSNWNMSEVQSLDEKNGGGNRAAIRQWQANIPEGVKPQPDSHVDIKKTFVKKTYIQKEWFSSSGSPSTNHVQETQPCASPEPTPCVQSQQRPGTPAARQGLAALAAPSSTPAPPAPAMINLLDDDELLGGVSSTSNSTSANSVVATPAFSQQPATGSTSHDLLGASIFDPLTSATSSSRPNLTQMPRQELATTVDFDSLTSAPAAPTSASNASAFSFIAVSSATSPQASPPLSNLGASSVSPQPCQPLGVGSAACPMSSPQPHKPSNDQASIPSSGSSFSFITASQGAAMPTGSGFGRAMGAISEMGAAGMAPAAGQWQGQGWGYGNYAQSYQPASGHMHGMSTFGAQPWAVNNFGTPQCVMGGPHCGEQQGAAAKTAGAVGAAAPGAQLPAAGGLGVAPVAVAGGQNSAASPSEQQSSSFDPFDPFAPGAISVCG